jgi:hypothetical protein
MVRPEAVCSPSNVRPYKNTPLRTKDTPQDQTIPPRKAALVALEEEILCQHVKFYLVIHTCRKVINNPHIGLNITGNS